MAIYAVDIADAMSSAPAITDAQRKCLSHQLRNAEAALHSLLEFIENKSSDPCISDLLNPLLALEGNLQRINRKLSEGTFCCLSPDACEYVAKFVGCIPPQTPSIKGHRRAKIP